MTRQCSFGTGTGDLGGDLSGDFLDDLDTDDLCDDDEAECPDAAAPGVDHFEGVIVGTVLQQLHAHESQCMPLTALAGLPLEAISARWDGGLAEVLRRHSSVEVHTDDQGRCAVSLPGVPSPWASKVKVRLQAVVSPHAAALLSDSDSSAVVAALTVLLDRSGGAAPLADAKAGLSVEHRQSLGDSLLRWLRHSDTARAAFDVSGDGYTVALKGKLPPDALAVPAFTPKERSAAPGEEDPEEWVCDLDLGDEDEDPPLPSQLPPKAGPVQSTVAVAPPPRARAAPRASAPQASVPAPPLPIAAAVRPAPTTRYVPVAPPTIPAIPTAPATKAKGAPSPLKPTVKPRSTPPPLRGRAVASAPGLSTARPTMSLTEVIAGAVPTFFVGSQFLRPTPEMKEFFGAKVSVTKVIKRYRLYFDVRPHDGGLTSFDVRLKHNEAMPKRGAADSLYSWALVQGSPAPSSLSAEPKAPKRKKPKKQGRAPCEDGPLPLLEEEPPAERPPRPLAAFFSRHEMTPDDLWAALPPEAKVPAEGLSSEPDLTAPAPLADVEELKAEAARRPAEFLQCPSGLIALRPLDVAPGATAVAVPGLSEHGVATLVSAVRRGLWVRLEAVERATAWALTAEDRAVVAGLGGTAVALRSLGRVCWVDEEGAKARRFTGLAELDDVEHFALAALHSVLRPGDAAVPLSAACARLPSGVGQLFAPGPANPAATFYAPLPTAAVAALLQRHRNKFVVEKGGPDGVLVARVSHYGRWAR